MVSMDLLKGGAVGEEVDGGGGGGGGQMYSRGVLLEYTLICGTWGEDGGMHG